MTKVGEERTWAEKCELGAESRLKQRMTVGQWGCWANEVARGEVAVRWRLGEVWMKWNRERPQCERSGTPAARSDHAESPCRFP